MLLEDEKACKTFVRCKLVDPRTLPWTDKSQELQDEVQFEYYGQLARLFKERNENSPERAFLCIIPQRLAVTAAEGCFLRLKLPIVYRDPQTPLEKLSLPNYVIHSDSQQSRFPDHLYLAMGKMSSKLLLQTRIG